jgi:hypothetical protein
LGHDVADLIQAKCVIPDGDHAGEPFILTDEMLRFLLWLYRIDPETRKFVYDRGAQLVRPQKWGKGPFSAAWICAECDPDAPVIPAGWDAKGEPVGRPWATPWVQVTAVSEDQTDNVWRALVPMIELGDLKGDIPDTGETRINLPGGGRIEPVTSSARSRLGQRITAALQDETHSWTKLNGGRKLADNQRRNLAGMGGRFLETTNAWDPAEESVAQQTYESKAPGVHKDYVEPPSGSFTNKRERRKIMRAVYGGSWWVDLDRIDSEAVALIDQGDIAQAERYFGNRRQAGAGAAFDYAKWAELADSEIVVPDRSLIVLGVDGARYDDALAIIATDVERFHQWPIGIWEVPENSPDDYEHPDDEVDGAISETFERYEVWRTYIDPQMIEHLVDRWQGRWGDKRIVPWLTNRPKQAAYAVRAYVTAVNAGDLTHDGDSTFAKHIRQAHKRSVNVYDDKRRQMWTLAKDRPMSPRKMDAAWAGCLSAEARGDAIAAGATAKKSYRAAGF